MDETLQLFKEISKLIPDAQMLIINRNEHKEIRIAAKKAKIDQEKISIYKLDYKDVPTYLRKMDASSTLIKPCFSKLSSSPTKLGEYLGCGIPCVGNSGVGDVEKILNFKNSGFVLNYYPYTPNKYEHLILLNRKILDDQMNYLISNVPKHSRLRC